ncbi:MAG: hypothetical protein ACLPQS_13445 [Acidimicrobiales bacterium]
MSHRRGLLALACGALALSGCSASAHSGAPTTTTRPSSSTTTQAPPSPSIQLTDTQLAPSGWVPIDYGHAQISVPATWDVMAPPACYGDEHDDVILGAGGGDGYCLPAAMPTGAVQIQPYPARRRGSTPISQPPVPTRVIHVNGLAVREIIGAGAYDVPSLGVSLNFFGHTDRQVLDTLTRSPRAVALGRSGAPRMPASWHRITFGGLSFSVPASWAVTHTSQATLGGPPCSFLSDMTTIPASATLSTAKESGPVYHCPYEGGRLHPLRPQLGLIVNAQSQATPTFVPLPSECRQQAGLRLCVNASLNEGILEVSMQRVPTCGAACAPPGPAAEHPPIVELGLAGSGLVDRTILDSFRVVSPPS